MPFQERSIVSHREEFCQLAAKPGANVRELCRRWKVGSATAYKWIARYRQEGSAGLVDRCRRPHSSPGRSPPAVEAEVLAVRSAHRAWGGRKIRRVLEWKGMDRPPAASTVTAILRRHDRLDGPGAGEPRDWRRFEHAAPNDLWQMDFKGHFPLAQGRCHPLTVLDDHSRYALEIGACGDEQTQTVQARLERVFGQHGLPSRILADNGPPWGTAGSGQRHSVLTVWFLDLGIGISHGAPYHPQTQGKDERFHRTLKAEVLDGEAFADLDQAQRAFDAWRRVYNTQRPHEAIGLKTPISRYEPSPRSMPQTITPPQYEPQAFVRKVYQGGWLSFKGRKINCSKAFAGRALALRATNTDGLFDLCYRKHVLARVDLRQNIVQPVHHVPEQAFTVSPV
jgi:transposase InsO family protein